MSAAKKNKMVHGTDLQQQILKYNDEKENLGNVRTRKRHHSGEQRSTIDNDQIILSDDDEDEYRVVTHQRKKF